MLLAPLVTFFFYSQRTFRCGRHREVVVAARRGSRPTARGRDAASGSTQRSRSQSSSALPDALPWLVEAWLLGVAFFSLRSAGGFLLLERERRRQSSVVEDRVLEICYTLQDRTRTDSRDFLLRMQVAASSGRDRMVSSRRVSAGDAL